MELQKKDFVEIEFTGRIKEGDIFDSNVKEDLVKLHSPDSPYVKNAKPFIFCLGEGMFLKGIDDFLIGKPSPAKPVSYEIELPPEKAFGIRDQRLIQKIPIKVFIQQKVNPVPGAMFNLDGRIAKILSVSGGRVIADFNNPLAGKTVVYNLRVLRKVEGIWEKAKAFIEFLFRRDLDFEVNESEGKISLKIEKPMIQFAEMFKEKFKEVLGMELVVEEDENTHKDGKTGSQLSQ